jgi:hypothetical protein
VQVNTVDDTDPEYQGWYRLRAISNISAIPPFAALSSSPSPATTLNAFISLIADWTDVTYVMPVDAPAYSGWVQMISYTTDRSYFSRLRNLQCHSETWTGLARVACCVQRRGVATFAAADRASCPANNGHLVWLGESNTSAIKVCGNTAIACDKEPIAVINQPVVVGDGEPCPFFWAATGSWCPIQPGVHTSMYSVGAQLRGAVFRASKSELPEKWAAGTVDDDMLRSQLRLVNLSALSANIWYKWSR